MARIERVSSLSRVFMKRRVLSYDTDGELIDLTSFDVECAFTTGDEPEEADWVDGEWESTDQVGDQFVRCLIGPDSTVGELADGRWYMWVRITADTERPVSKPEKPFEVY